MENVKVMGKVETEFEIKTSPERFYNVWKQTSHHLPNIAGDHIQAVDLHDSDDWESHGHGSIKIWKYTCDGVPGAYKERVEFDDENKTVRLVGLEGDVFQEYKSMVVVYQVVPNPKGIYGTSLAKLSIEFEKLNPNVPDPIKYLNMIFYVTKDIEAHLDDQTNKA